MGRAQDGGFRFCNGDHRAWGSPEPAASPGTQGGAYTPDSAAMPIAQLGAGTAAIEAAMVESPPAPRSRPVGG